MPSLIVSSRFSIDSQILRQAAQELGWETLRLDGWRIPDWFDPPDEHIALFHTAPLAFDIAEQLSRTLLGCNADWTVQLPDEFLLRELRQMTLAEALELPGESFIKHSVSKAFPAGIYNRSTLADATLSIPKRALVHAGEPVNWLVEYRCFVADCKIVAISPYQRYGHIFSDHYPLIGAMAPEIDAAGQFSETVIQSGVDCPSAFVLDVGIIEDRGWAVVEVNECWASGIYHCDPKSVLESLLCGCTRLETMSEYDKRWDFKSHYLTATSQNE